MKLLSRMRAPRLPGERAARHGTIEALSWPWRESWTQNWYPQGVDVALVEGIGRVVAVTWFRQGRVPGGQGMRHTGARVVFVLPNRHRRSVELVLPDRSPAAIHAGGLVWLHDRILVAASGQGIWEFRLGDALRHRGSGRRILPRHAVHLLDPALKASFLGRVSGTGGDPAHPRLVTGEYFADPGRGRLAALDVRRDGDETRIVVRDVFRPSIPRMQGAIVHDGRWYVSSSNAAHERGDLWSGIPGSFRMHAGVLPPGPEDIAIDTAGDRIWTVGEHPLRRVLVAVPLPEPR